MAFYNATIVKAARKPHRCFQCRHMIAAGETYTRLAATVDGEFTATAEHNDCRAAFDWLFNARGLGHEDTSESLTYDEIEPDEAAEIRARWPAVAKRLWPNTLALADKIEPRHIVPWLRAALMASTCLPHTPTAFKRDTIEDGFNA